MQRNAIITMSLVRELHLFSFVTGNDDSISMPNGTLNTLKSTTNAKPITPSSEFANEGSTYTTSTPSTVSFTKELSVASNSGNLSYKDYTPCTFNRLMMMLSYFYIPNFYSTI